MATAPTINRLEDLYDWPDLAEGQTIVMHNGALVGMDISTQEELDAQAAIWLNSATNLQNEINAETTARTDADTTLQDNVNVETAARIADVTSLSDYVDAQVAAEAAARQQAVTDEATAREDADTAEIAAREAADALLVPIDGTYAGAATPVLKARVVADANPRFQLGADGKLSFGPGNTATDTNLYRSGVNTLKTDSSLLVAGNIVGVGSTSAIGVTQAGAATSVALSARLAVDAQNRYQVLADGKTQWGPGGATVPDTNLYRGAAGQLSTDGQVQAVGFVSTSTGTALIARGLATVASAVVVGRITADTIDRYQLLGDGKMQWGSGSAVADTALYRSGVGTLKTDGVFTAIGNIISSAYVYAANGAATQMFMGSVGGLPGLLFGNAQDTNLYRSGAGILHTDGTLLAGALKVSAATAATAAYQSSVSGDAKSRFIANTDGGLNWGDGVNATDVTLYRSAVDTLKTDDALVANGGQGDISWGRKIGGTISFERTAGSGTLNLYATDGATRGFGFTVNGTPTLLFGTANDTNLYRAGSGQLKTDGSFYAVGSLYLFGSTGAVNGTGAAAATTARMITSVTGDAFNRFQLSADGTLQWGSGASGSFDTTLARTGAALLSLTGSFQSSAGGTYDLGSSTNTWRAVYGVTFRASSGGSFKTQNSISDAQPTWAVATATGAHTWGPGGAVAVDTNLYRSAAGLLKTDGSIQTVGSILPRGATSQIVMDSQSASTNFVLLVSVTADASNRFNLRTDGKMQWGPGNAAVDANFYRSGVAMLKTDGSLTVGAAFSAAGGMSTTDGQITSTRSTTGVGAFASYVTSDVNPRFKVTPFSTGGKLEWGDGTNALDTNLYRSAAGRLTTDHLFSATTLGLATKVKAGAPVDADWAAAPPDGTIVVDSTGSKIWARVGGAWKSVAIA